jgi:hypothetical protein
VHADYAQKAGAMLTKGVRVTLILSFLAVAFLSCSHPSSPDEETSGTGWYSADSLNYGDSVLTFIGYTLDKDSLDSRILKIHLEIRNACARTMVLDSDEYGTWIKIYKDSSGNPPLVWVSPENVIVDSSTPTIILSPGAIRAYDGVWRRLDYFNIPIQSGTYIIRGSVLGFRTRDLEYREL